MKVGAAMAIVCSLLARCVLASEPLESALARAHGRWTRLSTSRETTVLASDRGVTALVAQVSQARALIAIAQARAQELAAARRVLGSIADEDFTADGARRHHARVGQLEFETREVLAEGRRHCRTFDSALGELRGRVLGKLDTLSVAQQTCSADGGTPSFCAELTAARAMYDDLLTAVVQEARAHPCGEAPP
jgi:hypothetical protein